MAADLLPCPWCGAPGDTTIVDHLGARCTACGAMGPMRDVDGVSVHMQPLRARAAWNSRVATPAPTGEDESWHETEGEMPKRGTQVIASSPHWPNRIAHLLFDLNGRWQFYADGEPVSGKVTHWRPLPKPPTYCDNCRGNGMAAINGDWGQCIACSGYGYRRHRAALAAAASAANDNNMA